MQEYDVVLKALLQSQANTVLEQISGARVARWLPVELPQVQNPRMDLLGETAQGELIHIELQSTNEKKMLVRMGGYLFRVLDLYDRVPRQILLYVGERPLDMTAELKAGGLSYNYETIDMRDVSGERLLESPWVSDNVIAILAGLKDRREAVRRVLRRISQLSGEARGVAFQQLSILAGLRRLAVEVQEEAKRMPILNDIMDHEIIGPALRQGMQQGLQQGMQQGMRQGRIEGQREMARHLIEKRFGPLSPPMEALLMSLTAPELDTLALRVIDARNAEELFGNQF